MKGCRPLTEKEYKLVSKLFTGRHARRNRALFILGANTGFRISEILSLRVGDVYKFNRFVDRVTVQRQHMKKKIESRTVKLNAHAKAALKPLVNLLRKEPGFSPDTYLFHSQARPDQPMTARHAWHILKQAYQRGELTGNLGTHTMRKTFAARAADYYHNDIFKIKEALGQLNVNSAASYMSFKTEELDAFIDSL